MPKHDHFIVDASPGNAPLTVVFHNTTSENFVGIDKNGVVRSPLSTGMSTNSFPAIPMLSGAAPGVRASIMGPSITAVSEPNGTDSQGQFALFGVVKMLCYGTFSALDWMYPHGTNLGYMRKATASELSTSTAARCIIAYEDCTSTGESERYCLQLMWRVS